ncbi:type II secretion system protein GspJ [Pseudohongiella spirulinae]|uniref:Type II secretion system protein J n=1 Tax=Pseudohongiella spirulinae TaxID=1249552 RepID=A0A0S2KGF1_9GAMM|nr:type II secretion system protein GspJ [Pseudohongiella spirulinae]ALO47026.1 hypothetical protein PS2015_2392 [Pseudohongiella spirulinae]
MRLKLHRFAAGFTLIELLIAMSLTVMIGAVSYRFLDGAINAGDGATQRLQELNQMERFWTLLSADLATAVARDLPSPAVGVDRLQGMFDPESAPPALLSASGDGFFLSELTGRANAELWLVRHGWTNPLQLPRSELQRVLYRLDSDGVLYRDYWQEKNQTLISAPTGTSRITEDIESLAFRFFASASETAEAAWYPSWPATSQTGGLPRAVEVTVESEAFGRIQRILTLTGGY